MLGLGCTTANSFFYAYGFRTYPFRVAASLN